MATFDLTADAGIPWDGKDKRFQMYAKFSPTAAQCVDTSVLSLFDIPKGVVVHGCIVQMVTAAVVATSMVMALGITGGTTNGFDASTDLEGSALAVTQSAPADTYPAAGGYVAPSAKVFAAVITTVGAITTPPVFKVWLDCENLNELG